MLLKSISAKLKTCQRFLIFALQENVWIMQSWNHHEKVNHFGERQIFKMRKFLTYFGDDVEDMPQLKLNTDMLKYIHVLQIPFHIYHCSLSNQKHKCLYFFSKQLF